MLLVISTLLLFPCMGWARIFIDINAPSVQRIQIAIPDFQNLSTQKEGPELSTALEEVISNDLDMSGYFLPVDKNAFLGKDNSSFSAEEIRFKDWSVIGAELLLKGRYICIGQNLEVEAKLFDVFSGRQILGKRYLGKAPNHRDVMHRLANDIILLLTGHKGMFLSKFVYVDKATGQKEIYTCDFDGQNVRQITFDKSIALSPRWSPSGEKILFNSYKDGGPMLFMKDMTSGTDRKISSRQGLNIGATWAPDQSSIALTLSSGDNPDIYSIDLNGKILSRLTDHWGIDVSPSFSPDGSKMAFVSNRSGSPQIYVKDLQNGREDRVSFEGKYNTSPSWSKLNRIAFTGLSNGSFDIFTMKADGTDLRQLTEGRANNEDPCWSADGRYIVFSSSREGKYHLYIMDARGQNQKMIPIKGLEQTSPSWSSY